MRVLCVLLVCCNLAELDVSSIELFSVYFHVLANT